jgi:hypothetical protein
MNHGDGGWLNKIVSAVAVLLFVGLAARVIWWLIEPLVPFLIVTLVLILVYIVALGGRRR